MEKTKKFIQRAKEIHGDKYDYSKVIFKNVDTKVCIICPVHGEFWQTPYNHLKGHGCSKCGKIKVWSKRNKTTTEQFIQRAKEIHVDKYDYSKVEYVNPKTKVCIICPEHGEFWQTPDSHLHGCKCPTCAGRKKITTEDFIQRAKEIHGDKYDYSKVEYVNNHTNVCIISHKINPLNGEEYGEFWQTPKNHLKGQDMPFIKIDKIKSKLRLTTEDFIQRAKEIHGDKYDYSKVEYVNNSTKVCIICPEHGEFWQTPANHLMGQGCPICKESVLEKEMDKLLKQNNFSFVKQKKFSWLRNKGLMSLDFFIPDYNIAIECQGFQHFFKCAFFEKSNPLQNVIYRDILKFNLCKEHNITILYYTNKTFIKNNQTLHLPIYKSNIFINNKIINRIKYGNSNKDIY